MATFVSSSKEPDRFVGLLAIASNPIEAGEATFVSFSKEPDRFVGLLAIVSKGKFLPGDLEPSAAEAASQAVVNLPAAEMGSP